MQLCCIPLRDLRYLRENIHIRVLKIYCTNETPMSPADLADDADEPQNQDYKIATITRTTTCLSLRDNAALLHSLCVISVICGRITRKSTLSIHTNQTPMSPADLADNADEPQNPKLQ